MSDESKPPLITHHSSLSYTIPHVFTIKGIDHVVIRAADLERSVAFYRDVLGCSVERVREDLGLVHMRAGATLVDLISLEGALGRAGGAAPGREGRNMDHFCLRVEPFDEDALRAHLGSHGVEAGDVQANYGAEGNGPSLYIKDPDGNVVELKGPAAA
jgi:catechol 2,3-dioxygenase-like lactoylglutathione lyase family enzyme